MSTIVNKKTGGLVKTTKGYKGLPMEGVIASWYTRNTGRDRTRFDDTARLIANRVRPGARVLEVAPGPGYLAIELARRGYSVTALDISKSFVRIARENAIKAGVVVDVQHGNAAQMPFADASFDHVVCVAAFKNFTDPIGAMDEMHRVLRPGGQASIFDLRKDATDAEIDAEVRTMNLSSFNTRVTRWTFQFMLLRLAYTHQQFEDLAAHSRFGRCEISTVGIGCEVRLTKGACDEIGATARAGRLPELNLPAK
jgi:ubiquinone/menaquinone biosynthesis C-methylase UbiE